MSTRAHRPIVLVSGLLSMMALVSGCDSSSTTVTSSPTGVAKCTLALASTSSVSADGGQGTVSISAQPECAWNASSQAGWITDLTPTSGQGNGSVTFRAVANPEASAREGEIVVNDARVRVTQDPAPCRIALVPATQEFANTGGRGNLSVSVLNGCRWTATTTAAWISITSASGDGEGAVAFTVASNSGSARSGTISVGDRTATVTQSGHSEPPPSCSYSIDPAAQSIGAGGGIGSPVRVTTGNGCTWTARSNVSWITVTSGSSGSGSGSAIFTVAANSGEARSGTLTIADRTLTVTQATNCTYTLNRGTVQVPATGGTREVIVATNARCGWTASTTATWISITAGATGTGNGTVEFTVRPNTGASRSATLVVAGQTVTVSQ